MKKTVIGCVSLLIAALSPGPAGAWSHSGRYGSASGGGGSWSASGYRGGSASGGGGSWSGSGYRGGSASGGDGSWSAHGAYGGSASGGDGSWHGTTAYGTTAYGGYDHYYGGSYSYYHPPTTVNYYGSSCGDCGGWSTAGAAAVGLAAGTVIGAAATSAATSNAYSAGYAAGSAYAMGAIYATLPVGCNYSPFGGMTYYNCGGAWFSPSYGANGVYYRVVPAP
jgi:hypothetical protein